MKNNKEHFLQIRVTADLKEKVQVVATKMGVTMTHYLRELLIQDIAKAQKRVIN